MQVSIQTNTPFLLTEPYKPLRMFYLEEVLGPETQTVVIQQSRLWNDANDWPLNNYEQRKIIILHFNNINNIGKHCVPCLHILMTSIILSNSMLTIPKQLWTLTLTNCRPLNVNLPQNRNKNRVGKL